MNTRRRTHGLALVVALVAAGTLLVGCGEATDASVGDSGAMTSEMMPADAAMAEGAIAPDAGKVAGTVPVDREVIRTGYLTMRVEDVPEAIAEVHGLVTAAGGLISAEDASSNGQDDTVDYANITAAVPAADLDEFIADVSALGSVESVNVSAQDVTQQGVDLDARIAALRTSIDRMNELLASADRIEDLLAIETQLSARQAELDSLVAQRTWLSTQVAMSTVTVTLMPVTTISDVEVPGFLSGLESGWSALVTLVKVGITALGFLLPFIAIGLVIVVPIVIILVRRARSRKSI